MQDVDTILIKKKWILRINFYIISAIQQNFKYSVKCLKMADKYRILTNGKIYFVSEPCPPHEVYLKAIASL